MIIWRVKLGGWEAPTMIGREGYMEKSLKE